MPLLKYDSGSAIDEVKVWRTKGGDLLAYLHASEFATPDTLRYARLKFESMGLSCAPFADENGKHYLEIRNLRTQERLTDILTQYGFSQGTPCEKPLEEDALSAKEQAGSRKIQIAGGLYLGGDAFFMSHGLVKKFGTHAKELAKQVEKTSGGTPEILSSVFYALGSVFAAAYGKDQSNQRLQDVTTPLAKYLNSTLGHLPAGSALDSFHESNKHRSTTDKISSFLRRYPTELMNMSFAFAGAMIAVAAHQNTQDSKFHRALEGTLGVTTALSGLAGTFIKEKPIDPDAPKKHGFAGVIQYIQAHPLALAGYGLMASTVIHGVLSVDKLRISNTNIRMLERAVGPKAVELSELESNSIRQHIVDATKKWKTPPQMETAGALTEAEREAARLQLAINKSDLWEGVFRGVFVVTNVIAEIMIALSSKGHGSGVTGDPSVEKTVFAMAAEAIARQPADMHEELINQVGAYISHGDVLGGKPVENVAKLRESVAQSTKNPWATLEPPRAEKGTPQQSAPAPTSWAEKNLALGQSAVGAAV